MGIKSVGMFHTPKDWPELEAWIERHEQEDKVHLYTAAGMAWNLAVKSSEGDKQKALIQRLMAAIETPGDLTKQDVEDLLTDAHKGVTSG